MSKPSFEDQLFKIGLLLAIIPFALAGLYLVLFAVMLFVGFAILPALNFVLKRPLESAGITALFGSIIMLTAWIFNKVRRR